MKDVFEENKPKKINIKIILLILLILVIIAIVVTAIILYNKNETAKQWIDKNILRKEVLQEQAVYVELEDENSQIYAYSQYLGVLSKNELKIYNEAGNNEETLEVEVSTPLFDSSNRFLAIAEKDGQKAYLITNKETVWEKKVEGNISQIKVNKNGYVAIVIANTSYKTVIEMYNPEGEEMFKTYLSSTKTADISISNDNKYLAIAEVDTSGTIVQSAVKVISITKAQEDPGNSVEKTYTSESGKLITNVKYQEKNKLLCKYTDSIVLIDGENQETLNQNEDKKITFSSIEVTGGCATLEEKTSGLFTADSILKITNTETKESKEYVVNEITKEMHAKENTIVLNLGTELEFINKDGWLIKKYIANQEITNVVISNGLAGIVYRNKVEIIKL